MRRWRSIALLLGASAISLAGLSVRPSQPPPPITIRPAPKPSASIRAFNLKAGWLLQLSIEQQGVDLYIRVLGPDGSEIFQVDSPTGTSGSEEVFLLAEASGEYRIAVEGGGPYRARVAALRPASNRDRRNAAAEKIYHQARVLTKTGQGRTRLESMFVSAAGVWAALGLPQREADAWDRIGRLRSSAADWRGAQEAWRRSRRLYRKAGARRFEALMFDRLAGAFWEAGNLEEASQAWAESVPLWRDLKEPDNEAASANRVCQMAHLRGFAREALDCYERSLRSFRRPEWQAAVRIDQGTLYTSLGELTRALDAYRQALLLLRDPEDREARSAALTQLGNAYLRLGAPHRALPRFQAALNLAREVRDPGAEAVALNGMGLAWQKAGRLDEASLAFRRALAFFQEQGDVSGQGTVWTNLGWLGLARGEARPAQEAFQKAQELSVASGNRQAQVVALSGIAHVERRWGNRIAARDFVERALHVAESLRSDTGAEPSTRVTRGGFPRGGFLVDLLKASYMASRHEDYELLIDLLVESGLDAEALEASERSRARSLSDNLSQDQDALSLPEIQTSVLDRDTVLLEYALGEERSFLWWVTPDGHGRVDLPGRRVLEPAVRRFHEAIKVRPVPGGFAGARRQAAELSRQLLGPVAERIRGKRLLVVAPEILHYVPFEALPDPAFQSDPLIVRHVVDRILSASVLKKLRERQAARKPPEGRLAAVGDPASSDSDDRLPAGTKGYGDAEGRLPRLPDTARELRDILRLARSAQPGAKTVSATGFEATRDLVMRGALGSFSDLHFAAHGLLDTERPERSAILLSRFDARGRRREGRLTAEDVRGLDLPADLVVLSACQTALGRDMRGEEPMGLTHAFLTAGASGVVVSLWSVEDRATAVLMERFYRGLLVDGLPPAEALRQAQLALWRDPRWSAPFYWAGFVVEGDGLNKTRAGGSP
jgi:CHAT domain-containing protein/Tfp pilus assembly protein PilF